MESLKLNDGTVLENSSALEDSDTGTLFIYTMNGYTMQEVFEPLYDPDKTKKIVFTQNNGETVTIRGYKRLVSVRDEGRGTVTASLKKQ